MNARRAKTPTPKRHMSGITMSDARPNQFPGFNEFAANGYTAVAQRGYKPFQVVTQLKRPLQPWETERKEITVISEGAKPQIMVNLDPTAGHVEVRRHPDAAGKTFVRDPEGNLHVLPRGKVMTVPNANRGPQTVSMEHSEKSVSGRPQVALKYTIRPEYTDRKGPRAEAGQQVYEVIHYGPSDKNLTKSQPTAKKLAEHVFDHAGIPYH